MKKKATLLVRKQMLLGLAALFFAFGFFLYNASSEGLFNSPDETANAVFAREVAGHSRLYYPLSYDYGELAEFIHPRSTFVLRGRIMPVGFWGMPLLLGLVIKFTGQTALYFFTPVLSAAAALALYGLLRKIFSERVALVSFFLYLLHPSVVYYSARGLFPNVPFLSLLIIGSFLLCARPSVRKKVSPWLYDIAGALLISLGVLIRPNEAVWVALAGLIVLAAYKKEIGLRWIVWAVIAGTLGALAIAFNTALIGTAGGAYVSSGSVRSSGFLSFLLPFGFHPRTAYSVWLVYFLRLLWWYSVPVLLGFLYAIVLWRRGALSLAARVYTAAFLICSAFLFLYYGPAIDLLTEQKSIGVSFFRYWLPVWVFSLPFAAFFLNFAAEHFRRRAMQGLVFFGFIVILFILGGRFALFGVDGLFAVREETEYMASVRAWTLTNIPDNAVIATDREDKFFWPARQVMVRFKDTDIGGAVRGLLDSGFPVYYFTHSPDESRRAGVEKYLGSFGVSIGDSFDFARHSLYSLNL